MLRAPLTDEHACVRIPLLANCRYAIIKATERYGPDLSLHLKSLGRQAAAARADKDGDTVAAPRDGGGGGDMEAGGGAPREEQQPLLSRRHA